MTTYPCKYCGEHHHNREKDTVCDGAITLYPLYSKASDEPKTSSPEESLEELKALKNDYTILNTRFLNAISLVKAADMERDLALNELKMVNQQLWRLKNPGKYFTAKQE